MAKQIGLLYSYERMNEAKHSPIQPVQEVDTHEEAEAIRDATIAKQMAGLDRRQTTLRDDFAKYERKDDKGRDLGKEMSVNDVYSKALEKTMASAGSYKDLVDYLSTLANMADSDKEEEQYLKQAATQYLSVLTGTAGQLEALLEFNPEQQGIREYIHDALENYLQSDTIMNIMVDNLAGYAAEVSQKIIRKRVINKGLRTDEIGDGKYKVARPEPIGEMDTTPGKEPQDGEDSARPEPVGEMDTDPDAESDMTHFEVDATRPDTVNPESVPFDQMETSIDAPRQFKVDFSDDQTNTGRTEASLDQLKDSMIRTILGGGVRNFDDARKVFQEFSKPYSATNEAEITMSQLAYDYMITLDRFEGMVEARKNRNMTPLDENGIREWIGTSIKEPEILDRIVQLAAKRADKIWNELSPEAKLTIEAAITKRAAEATTLDECLSILAENKDQVPTLKQAHDNLELLKKNVTEQKSAFFALPPERHGEFKFRMDEAVLNKIITPALREIAEKMYQNYKDSELKDWVKELDQMRADLKRDLILKLTDVAKPYIHRALGEKANPSIVFQKAQELTPQIEAAVNQLPTDTYPGTDMERIQNFISRDTRLNRVNPFVEGALEFTSDDFSTISRSEDIMDLFNTLGEVFSNVK